MLDAYEQALDHLELGRVVLCDPVEEGVKVIASSLIADDLKYAYNPDARIRVVWTIAIGRVLKKISRGSKNEESDSY